MLSMLGDCLGEFFFMTYRHIPLGAKSRLLLCEDEIHIQTQLLNVWFPAMVLFVWKLQEVGYDQKNQVTKSMALKVIASLRCLSLCLIPVQHEAISLCHILPLSSCLTHHRHRINRIEGCGLKPLNPLVQTKEIFLSLSCLCQVICYKEERLTIIPYDPEFSLLREI